MANNHLYSDLDLTFKRQPVKGDVSFSYDEQAVIRSIKTLLYTDFYERLWQPTVGSSLTHLLFEPVSSLTASLIESEIRRVIGNYEPRATIYKLDVVAQPDKDYFGVSLFVFIGNQTTPTAINLILKRTR